MGKGKKSVGGVSTYTNRCEYIAVSYKPIGTKFYPIIMIATLEFEEY